jgi:Uma2 family endonuclease
MGVHSNPNSGAFLIEDFLAFTDSRPDGEKWELIDGTPVMSPSANQRHQTIVSNLIVSIGMIERSRRPTWQVIPGMGVKVSPKSAPVPDVMIRPRDALPGSISEDMIAAFEILSPSTADHDLRWKRRAYTSLPSLQHYIVIAQDDVDVIVYDRAAGFAERRIETLDASLDLASLNLSLALRDIYENTGVAAR